MKSRYTDSLKQLEAAIEVVEIEANSSFVFSPSVSRDLDDSRTNPEANAGSVTPPPPPQPGSEAEFVEAEPSGSKKKRAWPAFMFKLCFLFILLSLSGYWWMSGRYYFATKEGPLFSILSGGLELPDETELKPDAQPQPDPEIAAKQRRVEQLHEEFANSYNLGANVEGQESLHAQLLLQLPNAIEANGLHEFTGQWCQLHLELLALAGRYYDAQQCLKAYMDEFPSLQELDIMPDYIAQIQQYNLWRELLDEFTLSPYDLNFSFTPFDRSYTREMAQRKAAQYRSWLDSNSRKFDENRAKIKKLILTVGGSIEELAGGTYRWECDGFAEQINKIVSDSNEASGQAVRAGEEVLQEQLSYINSYERASVPTSRPSVPYSGMSEERFNRYHDRIIQWADDLKALVIEEQRVFVNLVLATGGEIKFGADGEPEGWNASPEELWDALNDLSDHNDRLAIAVSDTLERFSEIWNSRLEEINE